MNMILSANYWSSGSAGALIGATNNFFTATQGEAGMSNDALLTLGPILDHNHSAEFNPKTGDIFINGDGRRYPYTLDGLKTALKRTVSLSLQGIERKDSPQEAAENEEVLDLQHKPLFDVDAMQRNGVVSARDAQRIRDFATGRVSPWHRFTHPSEMRSEDELDSLTHGQQVRIAAEIVASALINGALMAVGNTGISAVRLPRLTAEAYKILYHTPTIGTNLKTLAGLLLPVTVALTPPLTAVGSAGWGLFEGATSATEYGVGGAIRRGFKDIDSTWDYSGDLGINAIEEGLLKPLPKGKEPFDITVPEAGRGFLAGVLGATATATILSAMMLLRVPQMAGRMFEKIWDRRSIAFPLKIAYSVLLVPGAAVLLVIAPFAGMGIGVVDGARGGYKVGFKEAAKNIRKTLKDIWNFTGSFGV